ncbi:MAG: hypothetical protein D6780_01775, partial [Candidatus Dadabacteria bacterium]
IYLNALTLLNKCLKVNTTAFFKWSSEKDELYPIFWLSNKDLLLNRDEPFFSSLIRWCCINKKGLYLSPFSADLQSLGLYKELVNIDSVYIQPIETVSGEEKRIAGALYCDSLETLAFSTKEKDIIKEVVNLLALYFALEKEDKNKDKKVLMKNKEEFLTRYKTLKDKIGEEQIVLFYISVKKVAKLFKKLNVDQLNKVLRTAEIITVQSAPQDAVLLPLAWGGFLAACDVMVYNLYKNRASLAVKQKLNELNINITLEIDFTPIEKEHIFKKEEKEILLEAV